MAKKKPTEPAATPLSERLRAALEDRTTSDLATTLGITERSLKAYRYGERVPSKFAAAHIDAVLKQLGH